MDTSISTVGVVGAGQMGQGIAQVAATSGFAVVLTDLSEDSLTNARAATQRSLDRLVAKERIAAELRDAALSRITTTTSLNDLAECDLVIEAIVENVAIKKDIFKTLDDLLPEHAILASNTSSISITELAAATARPDRFIGMHFMNPVPIMKLVEVIRGLATSEETAQTIDAVASRMGKTTVFSEDSPGFLVNRILMPMINEAVFALHEGVGTAEDIDTAMKLGTNQPMGPLTLADFIGLDTCLAIMEVLHTNLGDSKYRPCPLLRNYVAAGWLGRKSGRGFYTYS
jgi:3-hydroxybutyryl-CoA dehydrogenase